MITFLKACFLNTANDFFKIYSVIVDTGSIKKIILLNIEREYLLPEIKIDVEKWLPNWKLTFKNKCHSFLFFLTASQNKTISPLFSLFSLWGFVYLMLWYPITLSYIFASIINWKLVLFGEFFRHLLWFFHIAQILWKRRFGIAA